MSAAEQLFGPLLIGAFFNAILYGVFLMQAVIYYQSCKTDPTSTRCIVLFLLIVETINTGLDFCIVWDPLIGEFGRSQALEVAPLLLPSDPIVTAIISTPVQLFYGHRIYRMTKSKYLLSVICGLTFCSFVGAVTSTTFIAVSRHWDHFPGFRGPILTWLLASALCDIIISASLVWVLYKGKSNFQATNSVINKIMLLTVQTGAITSIAAIGDALTFLLVLNSHTTIQFIWDFSLAKLYSNSLLSTLNARAEWNRRLNDARSRSDRSFCHLEGLADWRLHPQSITSDGNG